MRSPWNHLFSRLTAQTLSVCLWKRGAPAPALWTPVWFSSKTTKVRSNLKPLLIPCLIQLKQHCPKVTDYIFPLLQIAFTSLETLCLLFSYPEKGTAGKTEGAHLTGLHWKERVNVHKLQHKKFWNGQKDKSLLPLKTVQHTCLEMEKKSFNEELSNLI